MKFIYTGKRLEVSKKNVPDLLDFLLEPNWFTLPNSRRIKTMETRDKIAKYWHLVVTWYCVYCGTKNEGRSCTKCGVTEHYD